MGKFSYNDMQTLREQGLREKAIIIFQLPLQRVNVEHC